MNRKVLILGGGEAQLGLIKTAKQMGLDTIVTGSEGQYVGYAIADKYISADILDKEKIQEIVESEKVDGISMCCSDIGLSTLGYLCDKCGLKGISYHSAQLSSNKLLMKEALINNNVRTAKYRKVMKGGAYSDSLKDLNFPLIIKAVNLQGSKGIYICHSQCDVINAMDKVFMESQLNYCIVEEFIIGEEFGVQAFVYNNNVLFILPHGDRVAKVGATNIPIEHYVPYLVSDEILKLDIIHQIENSIKALELNNCAVNVDMILKDNTPYVIELSGRAGANMLPEMVSEYYGINYYEMILRASLDLSPDKYFEDNKHDTWGNVLVRILYPMEEGIIKINNIVTSNEVQVHTYISDGDYVKGIPVLEKIGKVLSHESSLVESTEKINEYVNSTFNIRMLS
ncbi:ATP-grasp domain-containing protein [uncultured Bacteroides sp.]|uniref:ATP-grasp domain-containing protein n=1 Tax=uncultured Bacteroides sp. TaxID=162156 RepID=UPI0025E95125|nr:ATP-grasp domain-containing protein [uncultured Bacteroides sp.]